MAGRKCLGTHAVLLTMHEVDGKCKQDRPVIHEVDGKCKQDRPRIKWREQVKENTRRIGLRKKDAADWCRLRMTICTIAFEK